MTNEEVIKKLKNMIHDDKRVYGDKPKQRNEALDIAIKALYFKDEIIRMVNMGVYPEAIVEWVRESEEEE